MVGFIENINPDSEVAYFSRDLTPLEHGAPDPQTLELARATLELVGGPRKFPNSDLIITALERGVIERRYQHLLPQHVGALDPPDDGFYDAMCHASDAGQITEQTRSDVYNLISEWGEYHVYDATGRECQMDASGQLKLDVYTDFDDVFGSDSIPAVVAREHRLLSFINQIHIKWVDNEPVLPGPYPYPTHVTLGNMVGDQFEGVLSIPHRLT